GRRGEARAGGGPEVAVVTAGPGAGAAADAVPAGVLVYGLGRSGSAALRRAAKAGAGVAFYERRREGPDVDAALAQGAARVEDVTTLDPEIGRASCRERE